MYIKTERCGTSMFLKALNIPGSGLTAEQYRLNLIAQNISNVETTRTEKGGAYKRKLPIYQENTGEIQESAFQSHLRKAVHTRLSALHRSSELYAVPKNPAGTGRRFPQAGNSISLGNSGVRIPKVIEDPTPGKMVYDPGHPDANEEGYVEYPNVEMVQEMINMMGASRSYEANVQVVNAMKAMAARALEIGR